MLCVYRHIKLDCHRWSVLFGSGHGWLLVELGPNLQLSTSVLVRLYAGSLCTKAQFYVDCLEDCKYSRYSFHFMQTLEFSICLADNTLRMISSQQAYIYPCTTVRGVYNGNIRTELSRHVPRGLRPVVLVIRFSKSIQLYTSVRTRNQYKMGYKRNS